MTLYHIALGVLYGVLAVIILASLASAMLSSQISREEEGEEGNRARPGPTETNSPRRNVNGTSRVERG